MRERKRTAGKRATSRTWGPSIVCCTFWTSSGDSSRSAITSPLTPFVTASCSWPAKLPRPVFPTWTRRLLVLPSTTNVPAAAAERGRDRRTRREVREAVPGRRYLLRLPSDRLAEHHTAAPPLER